MMTDETPNLWAYYRGWDTYHETLLRAIAPLTPEHLAFRSAPHLRSVGENCCHIVSARVYWCHELLGVGDDDFAALRPWAREETARTAAELIAALRASWQVLADALSGWTTADLARTYPNADPEPGEPEAFTLQWVLWHLIEHDLHHGGEVSQLIGMQGIPGLDI